MFMSVNSFAEVSYTPSMAKLVFSWFSLEASWKVSKTPQKPAHSLAWSGWETS